MTRTIMIKKTGEKVVAALLEDQKLVEMFCQEEGGLSKGTVLMGKVVNVSPSLNAAFVDIQDGILGYLPLDGGLKVTKNQGILVQVKREKGKRKGAYLSHILNISGKYAVAVEGMNRPGISSRITEEAERKRLQEIAKANTDSKCGILVRTLARDMPTETIEKEILSLRNTLADIHRQESKVQPVTILHREDDMVENLLKDYYDPRTDILITNDGPLYKDLLRRYRKEFKGIKARIKHHKKKKIDMMEFHQVSEEIRKTSQRKVWLPCGGYLVFDDTEAMTVVDVNTGRNTKSKEFQKTAYVTNIEAAREIAKQIRLRNIGGIVVVDFVDMGSRKLMKEIEEAFQEAVAPDKKNIDIGGFTRLGMFELTRQKDGRSVKGFGQDET